MMNYHEIETLTYEHQAVLLAEAEQRRLAQTVLTAQPRPRLNWIGQQLLRWGKQLLNKETLPASPHPPKIAAR